MRKFYRLILVFLFLGYPSVVNAQPYGEGSYGSGVYSEPTSTPASTPVQNTNSSFTNTTTIPNPPTCTAIAPLLSPDLFQINRGANSVKLFFTPIQGIIQYQIFYGQGTSDDQYAAIVYQPITNGVISVIVNDLSYSKYSFKIRAANACAAGPFSNSLQTDTYYSAYYKYFKPKAAKIAPVAQITKPIQLKSEPTKSSPPNVAPQQNLWTWLKNLMGLK